MKLLCIWFGHKFDAKYSPIIMAPRTMRLCVRCREPHPDDWKFYMRLDVTFTPQDSFISSEDGKKHYGRQRGCPACDEIIGEIWGGDSESGPAVKWEAADHKCLQTESGQSQV